MDSLSGIVAGKYRIAKASRQFCCWLALLGLVHFVAVDPVRAQPTVNGHWSNVINWPIEAIHAAMLPTGKVMVWQSWTESVGLWDPVTQQFSSAAIPEINVFCSGFSWLPDGRLMLVGGHIANNVGESAANIYDPFTNSWADDVAPMNAGRWYPSATTLGNGNLLVMSGDMSFDGNTNPLPQVYDADTNAWRSLTTATKQLPLYPRTFLTPDGNVVSLSGYDDETEVLDTSGTGQWNYIADTLDSNLHNYGPAVMYDSGKIAYIGGGHNPTANISLLDLNDANPAWRYGVESMAQPRRQNDATILADGTVLITGGSSVSGWNDPAGQIAVAEIWDPVTEQVTPVAAASDVYRGYHTTATLLPDARVLITGGDHDHGGFTENRNAEIYSPAYLFNGARPEITLAPESAELGTTIFVETPHGAEIADITFMIPGATTHAQNWTQRVSHLDFVQVSGGLNVILPSNPNEAPPGYYMMFLINDNGVPSVAEFLQSELQTGLHGDFDGDGMYLCSDIDALVAEVGAGTNTASFDLDADGRVGQTDLSAWLSLAGAHNLSSGAAYLAGDANLDGTVDGADFLIWNENKFTNLSAWCSGDFNADGTVDGGDFLIWNTHKFQSATPSAVPEPSSLVLLGIASLLANVCRPQRRD